MNIKFLTIIFSTVFLGLLFNFTNYTFAQQQVCPTDEQLKCNGVTAVECARLHSLATGCAFNNNATQSVDPLPLVIGRLIRALFGFLGTIFLILVLYGGFTWMTAAGNDESVNKAKKIITQATIGLFIVVIGYALSEFIFDSIIQATGS